MAPKLDEILHVNHARDEKLNGFLNKAFVNETPDRLELRRDSLKISQACSSSSSSSQSGKQIIDFDDLLPHFGEFGKYQKILFLLMIPFAFFVAFVYFSQIFITIVPEVHWCRVPELEHLSLEER